MWLAEAGASADLPASAVTHTLQSVHCCGFWAPLILAAKGTGRLQPVTRRPSVRQRLTHRVLLSSQLTSPNGSGTKAHNEFTDWISGFSDCYTVFLFSEHLKLSCTVQGYSRLPWNNLGILIIQFVGYHTENYAHFLCIFVHFQPGN